MEAVAVVADATDERAATAELRTGDHRVGDRPAADQARFVVAILVEECLLFVRFDEPHRALLEAVVGEFLVRQFEEDIHE